MLKPIVIIFAILITFILTAKSVWVKYDIDKNVLIAANTLFLITGVLVFFMQQKAIGNKNPNVFIRSVIAGMIIKMFSAVIALLAYVLMAGSNYNTKAVFISSLIYLVYLGAEVMAISKQLKQQ